MPDNKLPTGNCEAETSEQEVSSSNKAAISGVSAPEQKPGELFFLLLLIIAGALGYYFALDLSDDGYASPAVFPKAFSLIIMGSGLISFFQAVRRGRPKIEISVWLYLMPQTVRVMMAFMVLYCAAIPYLHFPLSSFIFMVVSLAVLYRGRRLPALCLYSAVSLAILIIVFRYIMLVILP